MKAIPTIFALCPLGIACSRNVYTPPARPVVLSSPATTAKGGTAVRAQASSASELFGPTVLAGSAGVRHGYSDDLELVIDTSYAQITERSASGTNRGIGMARVGAKYRPFASQHVALIGGVGGGYSPAGGSYSSVDAGAIVGYENRYVVPFLHGGAFASVPLAPKEVNVTSPGDEAEHFDTPENTAGLTLGAGVRVPLAIDATSILVGVSHTHLWDNDSDNGFLSLTGGVETSF